MATRKCIDLTWKTGEIINLPRGNGWTTQSLAYKDRSHRYVICNNTANDNANNNICTVGKAGYSMAKGQFFAGHANGSCYCHKNGLVYVLPARHGASTQVYAYDPKTWDRKFIVKLDGLTIAGLAYDRVTNQFYGASTSKICVFSYDGFSRGGTCKHHKTFNKTFIPSSGYYQQDCGGHNGVIMCCHSKQHKRSAGIYAYIDCYSAKDGKYLRTYRTKGECESVAVEEKTNRLHVLYAQDRQLIRCTTVFALKGEPHIFKGDTSTIGISTVSESDLRNKIVKKAKSYKGDKGNHFWEVYGMTADWCAMFVWTIFKECGMSDIMTKTALVSAMRDWLKGHGFTRTVKTAKPGDIAIFGGGMHVEIVAGKDSSGRLLTIGGNTGNASFKNSVVSEARYFGSTPTAIFSPKYSSSTASASTIATEVEDKNLEISVDKLYSSDNFEYLQSDQEKQHNEAINSANAQLARIQQLQLNATSVIPDTVQNVNILLGGINLTDTKRTKTKINSEAHGPSLPVALNPVEAPFVQLTIGGYEFGVKSTNDTNYINGLSVVRTNGSMNEYTINLVHQVSPGRNPNFIDELLAANSYEKIKIRYGDAMSNVIFEDNSALLIGASVNFDFTGYNITYTIKATSSVISTATHKLTYPTRTDKGSTIIRDLINDASTGLSDIYPNMKNANYIAQNSLIPTNDKIITVDAVSNMNPLNYLKNVVSTMQSATSDTSTYYLVLGDNDFKIYEIDSMNLSYDASLYEVNINYPDDNQVFSFNCDTNFTWPLAYDFNGNISTYDYTINHNGLIDTSVSRNPNLLDFSSSQQTDISNNWWKNVTEFPITATLECRGLLSPLLLMTYIKINCLYYGQQRLTSGVYIVTGQQDTLTGSGYRTTLSLLRVAGPQQQITIDGRVRT